jgi:integrase
MARTIGKLSAVKVDRLKEPGVYSDGGGLYLQVTGDGKKHVNKSWLFQFKVHGRERQMGLGPIHTVTLAEARTKATECRKLRLEGIDPIDARRAARGLAALENAKAMTFKACAEAYIEAHRAGWRNAKHAAQWDSTLATYAYPVFGSMPVQSVDVALVMKVIGPIWTTKTETASRVRGRIESALDWAKTRGFRSGENPARWRGHLENLLPRRSKVQKVKHHAALPYPEIGAFMVALRSQEGVGAQALEFTILTAARTGEALGARREEFNADTTVWTVPAKRMKVDRMEHRVPLSPAASAIVKRMLASHDCEFVFPGGNAKMPVSNDAMSTVLERMERTDITVHGFRSTFSDWAAEMTNFPREAVEMALAHVVKSKVEAAYRRGDLLEKRRPLMEAWAGYCAKPASDGKVVPIGSGTRQKG